MTHDETAIVPYLRGELGPDEARAVATHLAACADCRRTADDFGALMQALGAAATAPVPDWGRYRAELRGRLERRTRRTPPRWTPAPLVLSGALAAVLLFLAVGIEPRPPRVADFGTAEEAVIGEHLDLLRQYSVVERLDLLEDLDVIRDLDRLDPVTQG